MFRYSAAINLSLLILYNSFFISHPTFHAISLVSATERVIKRSIKTKQNPNIREGESQATVITCTSLHGRQFISLKNSQVWPRQ